MLNFLRAIPTPMYGNYGGAYRSRKTRMPKDWLDESFKNHDIELRKVNDKIKELNREKEKIDRRLGKILIDGDSSKLKWYGKLFRTFTMLIFRT